MHFHHHGRGRGHGCGPRGRQDRWDRFAAHFAARWDEAQRRPGGRGRRMFDGSELRLVLLKLISDAPRHGYELIKAIEEMTGGAYAPSPGVVYPSLAMLAEMDQIEEQASEGAKKRFAATDAGCTHLAERREEVDALIARLVSFGRQREDWGRSPIQRAVANLNNALRVRYVSGAMEEDIMFEIVGMIDELTQKIERLK